VDVLVHEDVGSLMAEGMNGEPYVIKDDELRYLILGALRMVPHMETFPLLVREVIDNWGDDGIIKDFTIVTVSGLRYTVRVDYDGHTESRDGA
jgi:hypothetical protein